MKCTTLLVVGVMMLLVSLWLQRESTRGTFDFLERPWLQWLAANVANEVVLPPLTLVLYDEEDLAVAGSTRMAVLDAALFARAADRLGAVTAVVEGVPGDPRRIIEAAGDLPVLGAYLWDDAPESGWSSMGGNVVGSWREISGLVGRPSRFYRSFVAAPSGWAGPQEIQLVAQCGDRAVPSVLSVVWGLVHGQRPQQMMAEARSLRVGRAKLPLDAVGSARFWPDPISSVMSLNGFLVEAERFERNEIISPVRGHVVMLARATSDIARVAVPGLSPQTPIECWASAWRSAKENRLFLLPGWEFSVVLSIIVFLMAIFFQAGGLGRSLVAGLFFLLLYVLVAMGLYSGYRLLLPFAPALVLLGISVLFSLLLRRTSARL